MIKVKTSARIFIGVLLLPAVVLIVGLSQRVQVEASGGSYLGQYVAGDQVCPPGSQYLYIKLEHQNNSWLFPGTGCFTIPAGFTALAYAGDNPTLIPIFGEVYDLGWMAAGTTITVYTYDDENDHRQVTLITPDGNKTLPQGIVVTYSYTLNNAGNVQLNSQDSIAFWVNPPPGPTPSPTQSPFSCTSLVANPSSGLEPLNGVDLTANTANRTGPVDWTFDCGNGQPTQNFVWDSPAVTRWGMCNYSAGTYTARADVRDVGTGRTDSCTAVVTVAGAPTQPPDPYCEVAWVPPSVSNIFPGQSVNGEAVVSNVQNMTVGRVDFTPRARWPGDPVPVSVNPASDNTGGDGYRTNITMNMQLDGVVKAKVYSTGNALVCDEDLILSAGSVCPGSSVTGLPWCPAYPSATFNALFEWPDVGGGVTSYQAFLGTCNNWLCSNLLPTDSGPPNYDNFQDWQSRSFWDCLDDDNGDGINECGLVVGGMSTSQTYYFSVRTRDDSPPLACSPESDWSPFEAVSMTCVGPTLTGTPPPTVSPTVEVPTPTPETVSGFIREMDDTVFDNGSYCVGATPVTSAIDNRATVHMTGYPPPRPVLPVGQFTNVNVRSDGPGVLQLTIDIASGYRCACSPDTNPQICLYNIDISSGDPLTYSFFVEKIPTSPWWQTFGGGDVGSNSSTGGIMSDIPSLTEYLLNRTGLGAHGVATYKSGGINIGMAQHISELKWQAQSSYDDGQQPGDFEDREDFDYFKGLIGVVPGVTDDWIASLQPGPGTYYHVGNKSTSGTTSWTVGGGEEIIIFVEGDLTIKDNIVVTNGGFLAFIVQGNIYIAPEVTNVEGIYIADKTISVQSLGANLDDQFIGEGIFVGWADSGEGIDLNRDLLDDSDTPGEVFYYRPDLIVNAPDVFREAEFTWQEVAP